MDKLFAAIEFAAKAHHGQFRKDTRVPYIVHPIGVMKTLIENNAPPEVVIAGILHDTLEDSTVTRKDISEVFGEKIAMLVEWASEPDRSDTWENRKQHTIDTVKIAPESALLVICADKLNNLESMYEDYQKVGESLWKRFNRSKDKQHWYYYSLAEQFEKRYHDGSNHSLFLQIRILLEKIL
ncbi:HD domain-containing protein [candidate division KSB1 bacterium]|nr:HD domain-containing protein [candidate division KSB1 bacterium]